VGTAACCKRRRPRQDPSSAGGAFFPSGGKGTSITVTQRTHRCNGMPPHSDLRTDHSDISGSTDFRLVVYGAAAWVCRPPAMARRTCSRSACRGRVQDDRRDGGRRDEESVSALVLTADPGRAFARGAVLKNRKLVSHFAQEQFRVQR